MQHAATDSLTLQAEAIPTARVLDALALCVLAVTTLIAFATFRDYGLGWDDYTHSQYGALLIDLYKSGFADRRALSFVNLYMYGGGFDMIATLAAKVLPFGLFETRRLVGAIIGILGMFATWRLGRRLGGPFAGLIALVLVATCPLYYGHMFINAKDGPFAAVMTVALLGLVRAFEEYPRPTPATLALLGIGFGLSIGARVLGGFALMEAVFPLPLVLAIRARAAGWKPALAEFRTFLLPFIPTAAFAYLLMGLVWPWGVISPLNPFRAVEYFASVFEKPWRELFAGELIPVDHMPRSYVPTLFALQVPELMLLLGICGLVGVLIFIARNNDDSATGAGRRAAFFSVVLAATLPILIAVATRPVVYNGIRHIDFVMPPFAVLGGLAAAWIAQRLQAVGKTALIAGSLALLAGLVSPIVDMVRVHPYEYADYNHLAGGVQGARRNFMLDYWGLSFKQASQKLAAYIRADRSAGRDKTWTIAVCGPHPPVAVALGSGKYNIVWDPKGADFAMVLGEFYCAKLDAPVLFDVVRDGVTYARVYDLRGRDVTSLLTVPGIDKTNY
ncbi:MAG TPA: glycosyltransferase family 39 protein [Xanthobacteraceae bacterium]|nr:glycosyltransferase family 39 protein [Xanthobacteraceae bacterium]